MNVTLNGLPTQIIEGGGSPSDPIIVAMHGIGSNEADLAQAYRRLESQAVLAFPRSPLAHPPGYAWYRLIRVGVPDSQSFEQALETLAAWIGALRTLPGFAERPLILSGFSQGAIMALSYALRHPEQVAGVIAFSGYIPQMALDAVPEGGGESAKPRIFLTHGRWDQLFPFARLEETARQLEANGIRPALFPHDGAHDLPPAAMEAARTWLSREFPG